MDSGQFAKLPLPRMRTLCTSWKKPR